MTKVTNGRYETDCGELVAITDGETLGPAAPGGEYVAAEIADKLLAACLDMLPLLEHAEKCEAMADDGFGHYLRSLRRRLVLARTAIDEAIKDKVVK